MMEYYTVLKNREVNLNARIVEKVPRHIAGWVKQSAEERCVPYYSIHASRIETQSMRWEMQKNATERMREPVSSGRHCEWAG